ncbi:MAG: hypothetical protein QXF46_07940 [Thermofilaceae archaeon]
MRILEEDKRANRLRLQIESPEDLYYTSLIIDEGDLVTAWTTRQVRIERAAESERGERVRVKLTVQVKKVEFQRFSDSLRILGVVVEAPEWLSVKGSHHTIGLKPGDEVEIVKTSLLKHHERLLQLALTATQLIGILSFDVDEATAALLRPQGLEVIATIGLPKPGKEGSLKEQLKTAIRKVLPQLLASLKSRGARDVVVAAPRLVLEVLSEVGVTASRFIEVSEGGLAGLYEMVRRNALRELVTEEVYSKPRDLMKELIERLSRSPGRVAMGLEEVRRAAEARAIEALLILDEALLSEDRARVLTVLENAAATARNIVVVPPDLEGVELLRKSGGLAALLYFEVAH